MAAILLAASSSALRSRSPGSRISLDVVIRNLLVGHRFPGGVLDIQDTWQKSQQGGRDRASDDMYSGTPAMFPRLRSELESQVRVVGIA